MWNKMAISCGLSVEVLKKVQGRWTQDGDDGAKFLEKVDNNYFTLGQAHNKVLVFLVAQGKLRQEASNRGTASALKRRKARWKKS